MLNENHKLKWKKLSRIEEGDIAVIKLGFNIVDTSKTRYIPNIVGKPFINTRKNNAKTIKLPINTSADLFFWLGCLQADGGVSNNGIRFTQVKGKVLKKFVKLTKKLFNLKLTKKPKKDKRTKNCYNLHFNSRILRDWLKYIGFSKEHVCNLVLQTGKKGIKNYIEGCPLDGHIANNTITLNTDKTEKFIQELQILCASIGLPTVKRSSYNEEYEKYYYQLCIISGGIHILKSMLFKFPEKYKQKLFKQISDNGRYGSKNSFIMEGDQIPINDKFIVLLKEVIHQCRFTKGLCTDFRNQLDKARLHKTLPLYQIIKIYSVANKLPKAFRSSYLFSVVEEINNVEIETGDLEIKKSHNYIANGFLSHNTVNCPEATTVEEVKELIIYGRDKRLKGFTLYRDNCRGDDSILFNSDKKDSILVDGELPSERNAKLYEGSGPITSYTTITDVENQIRECFVTAGDTGAQVNALMAAIGRLTSVTLRNHPDMLPKIAKTLIKIETSDFFKCGDGENMIRANSLPQLIGLLLEKRDLELKVVQVKKDNPIYEVKDGVVAEAGASKSCSYDLCPECGQLGYKRDGGCKKCVLCSYTTC